ncbi:ABC transporter ATP-binding protein [Adhaeribacter radiodurans]|uniref:ABC transporter ATP-binding protein n=1 Tax=Adhaeribacter radiodurans TaxID=2745197 RepID=A0A7L7LB31_9BACT|nr:ATP-binding cassette domain-containing protein [Adhaeribacter radiodurans]QMU30031.1 ABC transporter ATP-binding protein [Adhaeribacter radiodurans]
MQIKLTKLGKRYNYDWIFRHLNYEFESDKAYAILGYNGSGKSTFINTLSGNLVPSEGLIEYHVHSKKVPVEEVYRYLSFSAPYLELVEELTLIELIHFHTRFKPLRDLTPQQLIERMYLEKARYKFVKDFSSGMKQRLKLGLAIYTDAPLLLLDEPTTNLDQAGINWYLDHVSQNQAGRLVVVCSNIAHEYQFCDETLDITEFHFPK